MTNAESIFNMRFHNLDQYLYHYTKLGTALEYILETRTLRFSKLSDLNDPRESKAWIPVGTGPNDDATNRAYSNGNSIFSEMRKRSEVLCFSIDDLSFPLGMGCFRPRMWAQYAENHKGICLMFEHKQLEQKVCDQLKAKATIFSKKIEYKDIPPKTSFSYESDMKFPQYIEKYKDLCFFTKNTDWKQEQEFRYVLITNQLKGDWNTPESFFFGDALKAIVCGADMPLAYTPILSAFKKNSAFMVKQIQIVNGDYGFIDLPDIQ